MSTPLRVGDQMTAPVITVRPSMEIMRLVHLLVDSDISGAVVTNESGEVVGIVTERDCIGVAVESGYFDQLGGQVAEFMSKDVETFGPNDNLMDVAALMVRSPHRRFPVVENGVLVGLISRRDVLRALKSGAWFKHE